MVSFKKFRAIKLKYQVIMAHVKRKHISKRVCERCGIGDLVSYNRPKSLHKTKRTVKPNLQKRWGHFLCQRCFRTLEKKHVKISPDFS